MTKAEAIKALKEGAKLVYSAPVMGLAACAWVNDKPVRMDTARGLMRTILVMERKSGSTSYWTIK